MSRPGHATMADLEAAVEVTGSSPLVWTPGQNGHGLDPDRERQVLAGMRG